MIRIAIADDDIEIGRRIEDILKKYVQEENKLYEVKYYENPKELLWDIQEKAYYDIFLLDIEMKPNGLEVAKHIREMYLEPYIVFVTSYVKYSVRGYEYGAYRYIIKEELEEKLPEAMEFMCKELESRVYPLYIIDGPGKLEKIAYKDIFYIYVEGKYSYFCTRNGESRIRKPLGEVYKELNTPEFVYADKGHIVNLQHVMSLRERTLEMRNGDVITVSFPQVRKMRDIIRRYWSEKL